MTKTGNSRSEFPIWNREITANPKNGLRGRTVAVRGREAIMPLPHLVLGLLLLGFSATRAGIAFGQDYPLKPLRIVTAPVGGSTDFLSRLIAQNISVPLGQQVIVDNRPVILLGETVARAQPDGYTLVLVSDSHWVRALIQKQSYDPVRDFAPISTVTLQPNMLVIHPSLPVRSVKELIALAKAKPAELNYATGSVGSATHLAAELFKSMAGISLTRIPYSGVGPALTALISGELQLIFSVTGGTLPHVKSGRLKALAVTTAKPSALVPGLPTIAASGLPDYEAVAINAVFAPAKTPAAIVARLNQEIVRAIHLPEVKEKLFNAGVEGVGSSPEQLAATIRSEMTRLGKVIREAGIKGE